MYNDDIYATTDERKKAALFNLNRDLSETITTAQRLQPHFAEMGAILQHLEASAELVIRMMMEMESGQQQQQKKMRSEKS